MAQRFEGSISLTKLGFTSVELRKAASAIVGRGGSGIKELTNKFPGLFIKVFKSELGRDVKTRVSDCDMVYISARNQIDVKTAAKTIVERARGVINGTIPNGPSLKVSCPQEAVGAVIGKGGAGLKQMGETAGDYCHIHFNRQTVKFEITANTQAACGRAKVYIGQRIRDFLKPKVENRPVSRTSANGFSGLVVDDCEPMSGGSVDEFEEIVAASRPSIVSVALDALSQGSSRSQHSIASKTASEVPQKIRWEIREELSKKVNPVTGNKLYQPFHRKDFKTGQDQFVQGVHAVPWYAVDDFIEQRQAVHKLKHEERMDQRSKELYERQSREQLEDYIATRESALVFPTLGSGHTNKVNGWGSKPSSIGSSEGVESMNELTRKACHTPTRHKSKVSNAPNMCDLTFSASLPPTRQVVDLTNDLLPTAPRQMDLSEMDRAYQEFLAEEEEYYQPISGGGDEEDDWWAGDNY